MHTTVSFELAKLLKEKGINIWSEYRYTDFNGVERLEKDASEIFPYAPTIAEVVMWLYEKYRIWISVDAGVIGFYGYYKINPIGTLPSNLAQGWVNNEEKPYKTPTEAYEAAIEYTLNNLI